MQTIVIRNINSNSHHHLNNSSKVSMVEVQLEVKQVREVSLTKDRITTVTPTMAQTV